MADLPERTPKTILVVDDSLEVLDMVVRVLERNVNFTVLRSDNGIHAVEFAAGYADTIDLLLSDVQMPDMSGPELGLALIASRPDIRVMLMSGMVDGSLLVLNYGWAFLEKPFMVKALMAMVEAVLYTPNRAQNSTSFDTRKDQRTSD